MNLMTKIQSLLKPKRTNQMSCEHGPAEGMYKIIVLGIEVELRDTYMCQICTEEYLNKYSTICAGCEQPIFPEQQVCCSWEGADHPLVHYKDECGGRHFMFCGKWGEGKLVTLEELYPESFRKIPKTTN